MGIRYYKPTSAGRRGASVSDFADITDRKKPPEKALLVRLKKSSGRRVLRRAGASDRMEIDVGSRASLDEGLRRQNFAAIGF